KAKENPPSEGEFETAWTQPWAVTRGSSDASAGTLTIVTLNLWHDQQEWPTRLGAIVAELRRLNPDVVALQEVLQHEDLPNQAETIARMLGQGYHFTSVDPADQPRRYGNAILTRHPVLERGWKALD